jgi:hypothetical protein
MLSTQAERLPSPPFPPKYAMCDLRSASKAAPSQSTHEDKRVGGD